MLIWSLAKFLLIVHISWLYFNFYISVKILANNFTSLFQAKYIFFLREQNLKKKKKKF